MYCLVVFSNPIYMRLVYKSNRLHYPLLGRSTSPVPGDKAVVSAQARQARFNAQQEAEALN